MDEKTIGIVGGMGPHAGADLFQKVLQETKAENDAGYIETVLYSKTNVEDRTAFLAGETGSNPAGSIVAAIAGLRAIGATVIGMPARSISGRRARQETKRQVRKQGG